MAATLAGPPAVSGRPRARAAAPETAATSPFACGKAPGNTERRRGVPLTLPLSRKLVPPMSELQSLTLPVLPLSSGVVLPGMVVTLALETDEARSAVDAATDGQVLLVPR